MTVCSGAVSSLSHIVLILAYRTVVPGVTIFASRRAIFTTLIGMKLTEFATAAVEWSKPILASLATVRVVTGSAWVVAMRAVAMTLWLIGIEGAVVTCEALCVLSHWCAVGQEGYGNGLRKCAYTCSSHGRHHKLKKWGCIHAGQSGFQEGMTRCRSHSW